MDYYSNQISRLIEELSCLPGIGSKSAARLAFHLIHMPVEDVGRLDVYKRQAPPLIILPVIFHFSLIPKLMPVISASLIMLDFGSTYFSFPATSESGTRTMSFFLTPSIYP